MRHTVQRARSAGCSLEVAHHAISIVNVVICMRVNPHLAVCDPSAEHVTVKGRWDVVNLGLHLIPVDI